MTLDELAAHCDTAESQGLGRCVLVLTRKRAPRNFDRVRVLPGVVGRICGSRGIGAEQRWFVDVSIADLRAYVLTERKKSPTTR
jgi:hypothetical protein